MLKNYDALLRGVRECSYAETLSEVTNQSYGLDISGQATHLRSAIAKARFSAGAAVSRMLDTLSRQL